MVKFTTWGELPWESLKPLFAAQTKEEIERLRQLMQEHSIAPIMLASGYQGRKGPFGSIWITQTGLEERFYKSGLFKSPQLLATYPIGDDVLFEVLEARRIGVADIMRYVNKFEAMRILQAILRMMQTDSLLRRFEIMIRQGETVILLPKGLRLYNSTVREQERFITDPGEITYELVDEWHIELSRVQKVMEQLEA